MSILHIKSNTIADFTGTVTVFNSTGGTQTVNATDLVRPSDWNSTHLMKMNMAGNTAGQSSVSGQDIVFMGGNNITLSASQGAGASSTVATLQINGPAQYTQSFWQPELVGTTAAIPHANGTPYFRPFELGGAMDVDRVVMMQQMTSQSATTASISGSVSAGNASSGTGQFYQSGTVALFSRKNNNETSPDYQNIVSFTSNTYSMGFGMSQSVSWSTNGSSASVSWTTSGALSFISQMDDTGGITTGSSGSSSSGSFSSTSTNANSFSSSYAMSFGSQMMSAMRPLWMPLKLTALQPAEMWMMNMHSTGTGSTNYPLQRVAQQNPAGFLYYYTSNQSYLEYGNTAANATSNMRWGLGSYSASSNTTTTIGLTQITSMGSNASLYFGMLGESK